MNILIFWRVVSSVKRYYYNERKHQAFEAVVSLSWSNCHDIVCPQLDISYLNDQEYIQKKQDSELENQLIFSSKVRLLYIPLWIS